VSTTTQLDRLERQYGELLERHRRRGKARDLSVYADRPAQFAKEVLGAELWWKQLEIMEAVRDQPLVSVRSANAVSKDHTAACLMLHWALARRGLVLLTAPKERQLVDLQLRGEIRRHFQRGRLHQYAELYTTELRIPGADYAGIRAGVATAEAGLGGSHAPLVLIVLTEANGIPQFALDALLGCATGPNDRVLAIGNPLAETESWFRKSHAPDSGWHTIKISAGDLIAAADRGEPGAIAAQAHGGASREWVEKQRTIYGDDSPWYVARVLGEFPEGGEQSLFRRGWIERAFARYTERTFERKAESAQYVAALDVARQGADLCCLALRQGPILRKLTTWSKLDTMQTTGRLLAELGMAGLSPEQRAHLSPGKRAALGPAVKIVVDETGGYGGGPIDRLREQEYTVEEFNFGSGARGPNPERYLNRRAEAYFHLRYLLENDQIALVPSDPLLEQCLAIRYVVTSAGKAQLESKDDVRRRIGRSCDEADAVVMAFAHEMGAISRGGALV
jgi:hypothetical protein